MEHGKARIDTKLVHAGEPRIAGAVAMPVFQSTLYQLPEKPGAPLGYHDIPYIRLNNTPNHTALHAKLAAWRTRRPPWSPRAAWRRSRPAF